jgi:hypothetical protein
MMRSLSNYLILIVLIALFPALSAQTVDEIIEKHLEAHGGIENWDQVEALEINGTFTGFSIEKPFHAFKTNEGKYYADLYLGELKVLEAFDGEHGWTIDPWQDIEHARSFSRAERVAFKQKAEFFTPFYHYAEHGSEVEYMGLEKVDGMEMHKLKLIRSNGSTEYWFLDPETYLEYHCQSDWVDFAYPSKAETYFDDFREVEGLVLPFYIDRTFGQRNRILQIDDIAINPDIDPAILDMPVKNEIKALGFLEGDWDVTVEVMTGRGSWYPLGNTRAHIRFASSTQLEENISYDRILPVHKNTRFTFHDASQKYRVGEFNEISAALEIYEGVLTDSSFVYDNTGIQYKNLESSIDNKVELKFNDPDSFIATHYRSGDEGKTWQPTDRFSYTRIKEGDNH